MSSALTSWGAGLCLGLAAWLCLVPARAALAADGPSPGVHAAAPPREGSAWVSWVMDGDTVLLVPEGSAQALKLRLQDIDAPERCQSGGEAARDALTVLVHRRTVRYVIRAEDSYGRHIGRLQVDRTDVGAEMVRQGMAWAYSYRTGRGPHAALQRQAQRERRGVFAADAQPMSPALFRQFHGSCQEQRTEDQERSAPVHRVPLERAPAQGAPVQRLPQTGQAGSR